MKQRIFISSVQKELAEERRVTLPSRKQFRVI